MSELDELRIKVANLEAENERLNGLIGIKVLRHCDEDMSRQTIALGHRSEMAKIQKLFKAIQLDRNSWRNRAQIAFKKIKELEGKLGESTND